MVTVLNKNSYPLMPCTPRKARLLLAQKKAKIIQTNPFTIQLKYGSSGYIQKDEHEETNPVSISSLSEKEEIPIDSLKKELTLHERKNIRCKNRKCLKEAVSFSKCKKTYKRWGKTNLNRHQRRRHA